MSIYTVILKLILPAITVIVLWLISPVIFRFVLRIYQFRSSEVSETVLSYTFIVLPVSVLILTFVVYYVLPFMPEPDPRRKIYVGFLFASLISWPVLVGGVLRLPAARSPWIQKTAVLGSFLISVLLNSSLIYLVGSKTDGEAVGWPGRIRGVPTLEAIGAVYLVAVFLSDVVLATGENSLRRLAWAAIILEMTFAYMLLVLGGSLALVFTEPVFFLSLCTLVSFAFSLRKKRLRSLLKGDK